MNSPVTQALRELIERLVEACAYVSPIAGAVATKASVKDIRNAGRFMEAVERAQRSIAASQVGEQRQGKKS